MALHYIKTHHLAERREPVSVMAGHYITLHYIYLTFHASERAARVAWHLKCARHHATIATDLGERFGRVRRVRLEHTM